MYRYDPTRHSLIPVVAGDVRALGIGKGEEGNAGANAPVRLLYVVDMNRLAKAGFRGTGPE